MILNCYIIDDEPLAIRLLESYVDKTPFLRLQGSCTNAVTALADLSERPVDLLFLDIQMPELNGLEFSKIIGDRCRIIFTTAFEQYAVDSYRVNALDYLLKPIDYPDFLNACEKDCQWYELTDNTTRKKDELKSIFIKTERTSPYSLFNEFKIAGRCSPFRSFHPCTSIFYRTNRQNQDYRTKSDRFWETIHSDFRFIQK